LTFLKHCYKIETMRPVKKFVPNTPHAPTCIVESLVSQRGVEAVVSKFKLNEYLEVIINRSVKLQMKWTGQVYEGRAAGMDFVSSGPELGKY
jgi:hypothetical protein